MSDAFDVDLFVIGGGSGGVRAARIAAGHGARVMLAEEFRLGGTCVIRGCVPKKLYVLASRFAQDFEAARGFGWKPGPASFDWQRLVGAKEAEITRLEGLYAKGQQGAGVEVVKTRAVIEGPHEIRLVNDGRIIRARHILVATGGRPNIDPALPGREHVITSNEVFDLETFPRRIVIAGGGYIALEFAGIFRLLGAEVTVIYRGAEVLKNFDQDMREGLVAAYERAGIRFVLNDVFARIDRTEDGLVATTRTGLRLETDQVLMAIGRSPNIEGLGLDKAGITLAPDGAIAVDAQSRTNIPHVFAVGDVTNRVTLTPVAIREGHAVADLLFGAAKGIAPWQVDYANIPTAVFTTPEIGTVGLTEAEARKAFAVVDIYRTSFRPIRATLSGGEDRTVMKIVVDGETDRVLGVHILGEGAGEMIQLVGIPLRMGATKADFDATMAVHPTSAEELVTMRSRTARHTR
ncbi:glutathione-disulfide reductase [Rhabdaerophilum sp. SD176]|uniref:glutathione-disulfide reductase n=1 Tax=Rhabdaerophilum sp. SD176 TaxID=2983548 RepID=UPI0024DF3775|nr:glutathione-disulfide reductase [Rhabdaerophilum sp. SD176]